MKTKTIIKKLEKARQLLIKKGWCQNRLQNNQGQFCALGAISKVASKSAFHLEIMQGPVKILTKVIYENRTNYGLGWWNDQEGRTKQQVLGVFTRAINKLKKR